MAKTSLTHRFSEVAVQSMAVLSERWGLDRTATIERALGIAASPQEAEQPAPKVLAPPVGPQVNSPGVVAEKRQVLQPKVLPRDPKEVTAVVQQVRKPGRTLTGRSHGPVPKGKK